MLDFVTFPLKGDDWKSAATKNAASLLLISVFFVFFQSPDSGDLKFTGDFGVAQHRYFLSH